MATTVTTTTRPRCVFYCADQRDGRRVHVDHRGNTVNGPSRLVHTGGRLECADGRIAEDWRDYAKPVTA